MAVLRPTVVGEARFAGDPAVVGKTIRVNNAPVTESHISEGLYGTKLFRGNEAVLARRPNTEAFSRPEMLTNRGMVWLTVIARLKPGVTPQAAAAGFEAIYRQFHPLQSGSEPEPFD